MEQKQSGWADIPTIHIISKDHFWFKTRTLFEKET